MTTSEVGKLGTLAARINAEYRAVQMAVKATLSAASAAVDHALDAGDLLNEAKEECKYGTFEDWLRANFEGSVRRAQEYMYMADRREELEEVKARGSAFLSIQGALEYLRRARYVGGGWQQYPSLVPPVPGTQALTPEQEKRQRAKERAEQRLNDRAEIALRTGNIEPPADLNVSPAQWEYVLSRVVALREQNIPNVLDALAHELHILVRHAKPEAVAKHLLEPVNDPEEAEQRNLITEDLRNGIAWLARVLEDMQPHA